MDLKTTREPSSREASHPIGMLLTRGFAVIQFSYSFELTKRWASLLLFCGFSFQTLPLLAESPPPALQKARQAVVSLYVMKPIDLRDSCKNMSDTLSDPKASLTLTQQRKQLTWGSGVVLKKEGLILTSYHVVCGAQKIEVVFFDGTKHLGAILKSDPKSDLAALIVKTPDNDDPDFPTLIVGDDTVLQEGEEVFAIGNILGLPQSVGKGVIAEVNRKLPTSIYPLIQTDVAMGPGSSGGALLNTEAQLIGLTTAIFSEKSYSFGVGFAVGARFIKQFLQSIES